MEESLYPVVSSLSSTMMKKEISLIQQGQNSEMKPNPLRDTDLGPKLGSSDLERLIIQQEQEFAEGFVKALEDLHKQNQLTDAACSSVERLDLLGPPGGGGPAGLQLSELPVYTTLNGYAAAAPAIAFPTSTIPFPPPPSHAAGAQQQAAAAALSRLQHSVSAMKDEPQTVPDMQSCGDSPPLSPIDMDNQERIKAERKKLRNRVAASKCRKRKLERISRLEEKVKTLKTQNTELASTASVLREQVAQLKQKVMSHVSSGCQLLPNQVQAY